MSLGGYPTGLDYTDIFCGAGGSSIGLSAAGLELKLAANHWQRAIETHAANFPQAEHLCADVNNYDMRRLPRTAVLWASPICTEVSPAGGRRRRSARPDLFEQDGPVAAEGFERTRATFWDVIRATEVHRYAAVIVENVVDVVDAWELFDEWLGCMRKLGYHVQFISVSSAHVGGEDNPHAPQWRDRLYLVFTRTGIPLPDVAPRPLAWCAECDTDVHAIQSWKRPGARKVGKYRAQYVYRCPNTGCRYALVEPYVLPAAAAIDWSDLGARIGDRKRPLAPKTLARIRAGGAMFAQPITLEAAGNTYERRPGVRTHPAYATPLTTLTTDATKGLASPPFLVAVNHDDDHGRAYPAHAAPLPPRTTKIGDGLTVPAMLVPTGGTWNTDPTAVDEPMRTRLANEKGFEGLAVAPFVTMLRANNRATGTDEPLATVATGRHHYLTVPPFYLKAYTPRGRDEQMCKHVADQPLGAILAQGGRHALVIPDGAFYVRNFGHTHPRHLSRPVSDPLGVITARDHHALVIPYYRTGRAKTTAAPLDTVTSRDRFALVDPDGLDIDDWHFRMLQPREHLRAQRFPDSYIVTGNKGEQTMQAGNAVSANVAQWLGQAIAAALDGRAAA